MSDIDSSQRPVVQGPTLFAFRALRDRLTARLAELESLVAKERGENGHNLTPQGEAALLVVDIHCDMLRMLSADMDHLFGGDL